MSETVKGTEVNVSEGALPEGLPSTKPDLCENCERREPERRVVTPTKKGAAGLPVAVWLCEECAALVPKTAKRKRRPTRGRISTGKYGTAVMRLAYRFGGFTARQLGRMLLLEQPGRFAKSRTSPERASEKAAGEVMNLLRRNGLMRSVGVWREHAVGERDGRIEELYYLYGEGVLWGARVNGVVDGAEAKVAYKRHQLPRRAEHAAYRNDIYLRWLEDFEVERRLETEAGTLEENAGRVVVSGVGDFSGESWEGYPYPVGRFRQGKPGREVPKRGRTFEWLYPDGHPTIRWGDGLECAYEVEAERESWAREAARKIDRYAGYWLRLYREMEAGLREPERRPLEEELARRESRLAEADDAEDKFARALLVKENPGLSATALKELRQRIAAIDAERPLFMGLPEELSPVVFVHQSATISEGVRTRLRDRQYPMPRYDEFREYLLGVMGEWADISISAINEKRRAAGQDAVPTKPEDYARFILDRLFVFTSWEQLKPGVRRNLSTGEVYEVEETGHTLDAIFTPLGSQSAKSKTTLRRAAEERSKLRQSEMGEGRASL